MVSRIEDKLGIRHISTHGYHPEGNARVERVHRFLGRCIQGLTDEQYDEIELELLRLSWAWNSHKQARIGCSPYAWMHGREPVTVSRALV